MGEIKLNSFSALDKFRSQLTTTKEQARAKRKYERRMAAKTLHNAENARRKANKPKRAREEQARRAQQYRYIEQVGPRPIRLDKIPLNFKIADNFLEALPTLMGMKNLRQNIKKRLSSIASRRERARQKKG